MVSANYEKGKIKVVWVERDPEKIYSKMFSKEKEAERFGETKDDYVVFALEKQEDMTEFSWKLLPYGKYKLYRTLVQSLRLDKSSLLQSAKDTLPL